MAEAVQAFRYRGTDTHGKRVAGQIDAASRDEAVRRLRQAAIVPIDVTAGEAAPTLAAVRRTPKTRAAITRVVGELAVLLNAGIALERAMALMLDSVEDAGLRSELGRMQQSVKEGAPLSRTIAQRPALFPPMAAAMAEAGEADGKLGAALDRLADALQRDDDLRNLIVTAMIYPIILLVLSVAVIAMMLLFVVPQFESLFAGAEDRLPAASVFIMQASQALRGGWWWMLLVLAGGTFAVRQVLRQPQARAARDRWVLTLPQVGSLVRSAETARFARTLGVLVEGGVPLPSATLLAGRAIGNSHMAAAVRAVAGGMKEGAGLTVPLAAAEIFPKKAIGFFRTGEEASELGPMLIRLADVLDRDLKIQLQRLVGLLTPAITVILGAVVATIIAAIMAAILGFNDLALV
ncbi:MAG: type II secretion system F family protein [Porphyrobacter sp. IPPAS B-1204]|nr:MAG: type II secretion system F family protein [Porphyrobacter sp. IPPAS B-1204]